MLQIVWGVSGTGKTTYLLEQIKARAARQEKSIFLVPEQFSASAELMIDEMLGERKTAFCEVYSFTSYTQAILREYGGVAIQTLTDAARAMMVRHALDSLGEEVTSFRRYRRSVHFCNLTAQAIQELKIAGVTPEQLLEVSLKNRGDAQRLYEVGLVYSMYETTLHKSAMDPCDRMFLAAKRLPIEHLEQTAIFIDQFDGFTAPQYAFLEKLVQAQACVIALCCDTLDDHEQGLGLFSPVRATAQRLKRLTQKQGISIAKPICFEKDFRHHHGRELWHLARILEEGDSEENVLGETQVWMTPAASVYDECKQVATRIATLVRHNNIQYRDIAVICRTYEEYETAIAYEFHLANIPFFTDAPITIEHTATASFFTQALALLSKGIQTESILKLLKTDLCDVTPEEIALLEDYAYVWQFHSKEWTSPFERHPEGFRKEWTDQDKQRLEQVEEIRHKIVTRISNFLNSAKGKDAATISRALYEFAQAMSAPEKMQAMADEAEKQGNLLKTRALVRSWNSMMQMLSQMEELLSTQRVDEREYEELFALLLHSSDLGTVPQTQDTVIFTCADRMRLDQPKVCFVLGLAEGKFPKMIGASGLLNHSDREILVKSGIEIHGGYENRLLLEQMFLYRALTAPSQRLYLSYTTNHGAEQAALALERVIAKLKPQKDEIDCYEFAVTPATAIDWYASHYREQSVFAASLRQALQTQPESIQASLHVMDQAAQKKPFQIENKRTIKQLLGNELALSPTKIEQYYRCHFAYFLQYVLKVKPKRKAELSALESGILIHYVLEQALQNKQEQFLELSQEELKELAETLTKKYVEEHIPKKTVRLAYLLKRLSKAVFSLLYYLQQEQKQSSFHPIAWEQAIGMGKNDITPMKLVTPDGVSVQIIGQIDRIDMMQREGKTYIRVMDYKTGSKKFSLQDVYCGLNTQMLFYLFSVCEDPKWKEKNPIAAGVLYLQGDPVPAAAKTKQQASTTPVYQVDGLILYDELVLHGMDRDQTGIFVPISFLKKGGVRKSEKLASLAKLGEMRNHIVSLAQQMAQELYDGEIDAVPLQMQKKLPCEFCDYLTVCCREQDAPPRILQMPEHLFEVEQEKEESE